MGNESGEEDFASSVIGWQRRSGRHHLPWQNTTDPYRIWLSEIMLQQTQVAAVIPYFLRFVERFPTVQSLACADQDAVLAQWSGLGYYARARNLHRAARLIGQRDGGRFPDRFDDIVALPGVGRSTAGAIAVFAFGGRFPILDGNVKRVFARYFGIDGYPGSKVVSDRMWQLAEAMLPVQHVATYTQGLMDLGAQICTRAMPQCDRCPLARGCAAKRMNRINELPAPRPKKPRPQRATVMLILSSGGKVLLEKRPSAGIWGGLWSLPETDSDQEVPRLCQQRFGVEINDMEALAPLEHGFTHFSLSILPLHCRVDRFEARAEMPGREWVHVNDVHAYALPVPVRKLLSGLERR